MKKSFKKIVILFSSLVFLSVPIVDTTTNAFAATKTARTTRNKFKKKKTKYLVIKGIKISEARLLKKISHAKITYMADNIDEVLKNKTNGNDGDNQISPRFAPVIVATAVIPGLGEIALTAAGAIIIGGIAIKAGSSLYKKCIQLFKAHRSNKRKNTKKRHEHGEKRRNKKEKKKTKKGWKNHK